MNHDTYVFMYKQIKTQEENTVRKQHQYKQHAHLKVNDKMKFLRN